MKVYEFEVYKHDQVYILAPNKREAVKEFESEIGHNASECYNRSLTDDECNQLYVIDMNEPDPGEGEIDEYDSDNYARGFKIVESFADYIKGKINTQIISQTFFLEL